MKISGRNVLRAFALSLFVFSFLTPFMLLHSSIYAQSGGWRVYKGAWFDIKYPSKFSVHPSLRSSSSSKGYDSVFFRSPDNSVEFYVFSPQWNGEPSDIEINNATETFVTNTTERKGSRVVRRATIKAKDESYTRSFEDVEDEELNTRRVFAIKYRNQDALIKYRQTYLTFKASLKQYAD